jgi:hypothetical protein
MHARFVSRSARTRFPRRAFGVPSLSRPTSVRNATAPSPASCASASVGWDAVWRTGQHPAPSRFQPGTVLRSGLGRHGQQAAAGTRLRDDRSQTRHAQYHTAHDGCINTGFKPFGAVVCPAQRKGLDRDRQRGQAGNAPAAPNDHSGAARPAGLPTANPPRSPALRDRHRSADPRFAISPGLGTAGASPAAQALRGRI